MEKVRKTIYNDIEILVVDYSDSTGRDLIEIFDTAKNQVAAEGAPVLVLNIVNNRTFLTPDFMRHVEREVRKMDSLVDKQAIVGLSKVQEWILKGLNLWYKKQIYKFDTVDDALRFLVKPD